MVYCSMSAGLRWHCKPSEKLQNTGTKLGRENNTGEGFLKNHYHEYHGVQKVNIPLKSYYNLIKGKILNSLYQENHKG